MFLDHFEKVFVISLRHREDRRESLCRAFVEFGLVEPDKVDWVQAVDGRLCPPPQYFSAGTGAWGCYQTHMRIVQDAAMNGLENYLVIEDDAIFSEHSGGLLRTFMEQLPGDWDQLFLGGQHVSAPEIVSYRPMVMKATQVTRTHAFALRNTAYNVFQQYVASAPDYIANGGWHVDHQIGKAHQENLWKTYVPSWWISGQGGGESNIANQNNPPLWWHWEHWASSLPFIFWPSDKDAGEEVHKYVHFGNHIGGKSCVSRDLNECQRGNLKLVDWLRRNAQEALSQQKLPGISHPDISIEEVVREWGKRVLVGDGLNFADLIKYPFNGLFAHPVNRDRQKSLESFLPI